MTLKHIHYNEAFNKEFPYLHLQVQNGQMTPYQPSFGLMHWHEELQILYVSSGQLLVKTLQEEIALQTRQAIFINKNIPHLIETKENVHYHSFVFPKGLLLFQMTSSHRIIDDLVSNQSLPTVIFQPMNSQVIEALEALVALGQVDSTLDMFEVQMTLCRLFLLLLKSAEPIPKSISTRRNLYMREMLKYIANSYSEKITLKQIASSAHISQSECHRQFKHYFGTSPHQYLLAYRLEKAKIALETHSNSISELALENGFSQASHFGKLFKEKYGLTPKQYQKSFSHYDFHPRYLV